MPTRYEHGFAIGDGVFIQGTAWYGEVVGAGPAFVRVYWGAFGTCEYSGDALAALWRDRGRMLAGECE